MDQEVKHEEIRFPKRQSDAMHDQIQTIVAASTVSSLIL
jgi:hypothetical protein